MSKHTEGPWTAKPFDRTWVVCFGGDEYLIGGVHLNREANARLIAAAPELLEALKTCELRLTYLAQESIAVGYELKAARAALAKATGEQA